ncbi:DNA primase noncatalytic subunit PriX [Candidatus Bathyarchaeota archaeon]|nr:DNA primase noncatalytic subunit PriX [Candidatus Bathyarchaeota archaeon]
MENYASPSLLKYGNFKREGEAYRWIEELLKHPVDDGRHRLLWLVVAPYLVNVKGVPVSEAEKIAYDWLVECCRRKKVEGDLRRLAKYYVNYASRRRLKPLSFQTLKSQYPELFEIVENALKSSNFQFNGGSSEKPLKYKTFEIIANYEEELRRLPLIAIRVVEEEWEYEIEKSTLVEAKAIVRRLLNKFKKYPKTEHWKKGEEENLLLGLLAEKILDMTLNQFKVQHVWNHPIIQDLGIRKGEPSEPDFIVGNDKVEVKASSSKRRPESYFVNRRRFEEHYADIYVFIRFDESLSKAWISGWLTRGEVSQKTVEKLKYGEAFKIPLRELNPFKTLLKKWNADEIMLKTFYD